MMARVRYMYWGILDLERVGQNWQKPLWYFYLVENQNKEKLLKQKFVDLEFKSWSDEHTNNQGKQILNFRNSELVKSYHEQLKT